MAKRIKNYSKKVKPCKAKSWKPFQIFFLIDEKTGKMIEGSFKETFAFVKRNLPYYEVIMDIDPNQDAKIEEIKRICESHKKEYPNLNLAYDVLDILNRK